MATGLTAKIRLVKCPRCRRLLPELPDIPVYKCGGCGAVLQGNALRHILSETFHFKYASIFQFLVLEIGKSLGIC